MLNGPLDDLKTMFVKTFSGYLALHIQLNRIIKHQ